MSDAVHVGGDICFSNRRFLALHLDENYLTGFLPDSLHCLARMQFLDVHAKNGLPGRVPEYGLSGSIPDAFSSLAWLAACMIQWNKFTGLLPDSVAQRNLLQAFLGHNNQLSGQWPHAMRSMRRMVHFCVHWNYFAGTIPDNIQSCSKLLRLQMYENEMSGRIPDAITSLRTLQYLEVGQNERMAGTLPDGLWLSRSLHDLRCEYNSFSGSLSAGMSLVNLGTGRFSCNRFRGAIPDAIAALQILKTLGMSDNDLKGSLPQAIGSLLMLEDLRAKNEQLSGHIPEAVMASRNLEGLEIGGNLRGSIPEAIGRLLALRQLVLWKTSLSGSLPDALRSQSLRHIIIESACFTKKLPGAFASLLQLDALSLRENMLSGSIPEGLCSLQGLRFVEVGLNDFTGHLPACFRYHLLKCEALGFDHNRLEGWIPAGSFPSTLHAFHVAGNWMEGKLPEAGFASSNDIVLLDLSGDHLQSTWSARLHGILPAVLARALSLRHCLAHDNHLMGRTPCFASSLETLALHENILRQLAPDIGFQTNSTIFLQHNALSCRLPEWRQATPRQSLVAMGNQLRIPRTEFPAWVSSLERDGLFWSSGREATALCLRMVVGAGLFVGAVRLRCGQSALIACWPYLYEMASLTRIGVLVARCMAPGALLCVLCLTFLLDWNFYACPRSLSLASACQRELKETCIAVFLWGQLRLHPSLGWLTSSSYARSGSNSVGIRATWIAWFLWIPIMVFLSSVSMVNMASKCVPGFLYVDGLWLKGIDMCMGLIQGLLSGILIPSLADILTPAKYDFISVACLVTQCFFPGFVVFFFDHSCLGHWTSWWSPCSNQRSQFELRLPLPAVENVTVKDISVLRAREVCTPRPWRSASKCLGAMLLKLQDVLLAKLVTLALLLPSWQLISNTFPRDAGIVAVNVLMFLEFALLFSGALPLSGPLVLLAVSTHLFIALVARREVALQLTLESCIGAKGLNLAVHTSTALHLALASRASVASDTALAIVCVASFFGR